METQLLRAILMTMGRQTFPVSTLLAIVAPVAGSEKQVAAFNLCDGHHTQADISKETGIDKGNLSRSMARWIEAGILFRVGADELPLHIYPIPKSAIKTAKAGD